MIKKPLLPHTLVFLCCITLLWVGVSKPDHNWDIVGYVGASFYSDGYRGTELRDKTYASIKKELPNRSYEDLVKGEYRAAVASSASSLEEHMPFYRIRLFYNLAVEFTSKYLGVGIATSTVLVAAFFNALTLLMCWMLVPNKTLISSFFLVAAATLTGQIHLSSLSTPDSMAAFVCLLAVYLYRKESIWMIPVLIVLPLVRTDAILASWLLALLIVLKKRYAWALSILFGSGLSYWGVNIANDNYGYLRIFNFTLIGINPHPATMPIASDLTLYLKAYVHGFKEYFSHRHFLIFLVYAFVIFRRSEKFTKVLNEPIFLLVNAYTLAHLILFPAYYERFFVWCAMLAMIDVVYKLQADKYTQLKPTTT